MVEDCGVSNGRRLGKGDGKIVEEGDVGGERRDDFLVWAVGLVKNSELGLNTERRNRVRL